MYVSDADGDDFTEACLPVNLEDDGYNLIHTHDDYGAFILAGARVGGRAGRSGRAGRQGGRGAGAEAGRGVLFLLSPLSK